VDPTTAASPPGVVLSADGTRGAVAGQDLTAQIFDPRTGRAGPTGPTTTYDALSALSFAPDDTLGQLHISGALDLVDSADGSPQRTLVSRTGNVGDSGAPLAFHGAGAGATPKIAFGPDNTMVAVAHDSIGVELWDRQTGESLALLGGFLTPAERNIEPTPVNGDRDFRAMHRSSLEFVDGGDALRESDIRELVRFTDGLPTHDYSSLLRTITWSLRPSDWARAACAVAGRDLTHQEWDQLIGSTTPYQQTCTPLLTNTSQHG
jgi:WD40 repeat protein